jgi:hypothetical protein
MHNKMAFYSYNDTFPWTILFTVIELIALLARRHLTSPVHGRTNRQLQGSRLRQNFRSSLKRRAMTLVRGEDRVS